MSATILPFPSEGAVVYYLIKGDNPYLVFLSASAGNCLGATVTYFMGVLCDHYLLNKYIKIDRGDKKIVKALDRVRKYNGPVLLLSWIPFIGDPMILAAGILQVRLRDFMIYAYTGRMVRYVVMIYGIVLGRGAL